MMPIRFSTASGSSVSVKLKWCGSAAFKAMRMVSKGKRRMPSASASGPVMSGDAEVADDLLLVRLPQRFHGAALGEDRLDVFGQADVVELPEVQMIGLQQL